MRATSLLSAVVLLAGCSAAPEAPPSTDDAGVVVPDEPRPQIAPTDPARAPGTFLALDAATFQMSRGTDRCRGVNEHEHVVTLTRRLELMKTEVTRKMFRDAMGFDPSNNAGGDDHPVDSIHWHLAASYANAVSARTGATACYRCTGDGAAVRCVESPELGGKIHACLGYRLPTEAEWEYAYRAGTTTTTYGGEVGACSGLDPILAGLAWYRANGDTHSHPVATKTANAWGFHDMSGNVWEWTHDGFETDLGAAAVVDPVTGIRETRVIRGGSYNCEVHEVRGGHRSALPPTTAGMNVGFRIARTLGG